MFAHVLTGHLVRRKGKRTGRKRNLIRGQSLTGTAEKALPDMTWHMPAAGHCFIKDRKTFKPPPASNNRLPKRGKALVTRPAAGKGK